MKTKDDMEILDQEQWDLTFPEESPQQEPPQEQPPVRPRRLGPEKIMAILVLLCAVVVGVALVFSLPHMAPRDEDPEHVLDREHPPVITQPTEFLEPTQEATQPENPTIPPERNPYGRLDFQYDQNNYLKLQNLPSSAGVDVSAYQGEIQWQKVKASGIQFAMIRLGYRGYGTGKLVEDERAQVNLREAGRAGLQLGAYFFSQALTVEEAQEEMDFMLEILGDTQLDMPIVLDWEIPAADARTARMDSETLMEIQLYFCREMEKKGYQPMVYFNWHQSENLYVLHDLEDYPFWLALYQNRMTYPWKVEMWQYTDKGRVPGIQGNVDLNVYMPE